MKPLVIFHDKCTDGFAAAFAAWLKFGDEAEYLPMNYSDTSPDVMAEECREREVFILDFSFKRPVMDHIFASAGRVVWLDHHKTAFEMWCGEGYPERYEKNTSGFSDNPYIVLDNNKSGAMLAWEYFHPDKEVPMLIRHIDDRDRWQFKLDGSKELHAALASMQPWSFEQWNDILDLTDDVAMPDLYLEGSAILRAQDAAVERMVKQARKCDLSHIQGCLLGEDETSKSLGGLACNSQNHISELGHELANQSGTFGLVWYLGQDNKVKCSLRSNGDYDVSAIAKALGGGGHLNASGFETDIYTVMGWLK